MGSHASNDLLLDNEGMDLQQLLDAFGSSASLQEIGSAYLRGGRDIHTAFEILLSTREASTSGTSSLSSKDERDVQGEFSQLSNEFIKKASLSEMSTIATNQKKGSVSMGTVVDIIGKDYAKPKLSRNISVEGAKPPKLNIEEFPVYEDTPSAEILHKDTEDFLFKMLGDGFQLDRSVIREVLGFCGYDVVTSVDKLLDISASTLDSGDSFNFTAEEPQKISSDACKEPAGRLVAGPKLSKSNKDKRELEKDLMGSLFAAPQRIEEAPKQTGLRRAYRKPRAFGRIVSEPYMDRPAELTTPVVTMLGREEENEEDENEYGILRKATKEYWTTMKEYYKAAVDAYAKGNYELADKLTEEGHFFKEKACEADEKSVQKFLEPRQDVMSLDLHEYDPSEAVRFLKIQLKSLSGIEAIPILKIIVAGDNEGPKDGGYRKRKMKIQKLLEKESIKWDEERDGRSLVIKLGDIDPKSLSFAKK